MAVKFLDNTGLGYFWSKIKAWCNATFAAITHNQASNTINAMTGYSKPNSGSAIATSDNLNSAIGKLEAKVDAAVANSDGIPVGSVVWLSTSTVPVGFLLCNGQAVGRDTYPDLFNAIGTTYGAGDGSTTFNLPNLIGKFAEGANSNIGDSIDAGLPNIEGSVGWGSNSLFSRATGSFSGIAPTGSKYVQIGETSYGTSFKYATFDASQSNSIYGNSSTVQPPAVKLLPCIKAYSSVSNISELNAAQLENEIQNNYVHLTGDQNIDGIITVSNSQITQDNVSTKTSFYIRNPEVTRGVFPEEGSYFTQIVFGDAEGELEDPNQETYGRLGLLEHVINSTGTPTYLKFSCYDFNNEWTTNSDKYKAVNMYLGYDANGIPFFEAPVTSSERSNSNDVITRGFLSSNYLPLTGGTLTGSVKIKRTNQTRGITPSTQTDIPIADWIDSANNRMGLIESSYYTDKSSNVGIYAYNTTIASGANIGSIKIGCDSSGNVFTSAPTPATSDNSTKIATTAFVKNQAYASNSAVVHNSGNETVSGTKTFNNRIKGTIESLIHVTASTTPSSSICTTVVAACDDTPQWVSELYYCREASTNGTTVLRTWSKDHSAATHMSVYYDETNKVGYLRFDNLYKDVTLANPNFRRGGTRSSTEWWSIGFKGNNSSSDMGSMHQYVDANGQTEIQIRCAFDKSTYSYKNYWLWTKKDGTSAAGLNADIFRPTMSTAIPLGGAGGARWGQIYSTNSTISTSDEREKCDIETIPDDILDAWESCEFYQYKMKDSVEKKGDNARYHTGMIAQRLDTKFKNINKNLNKYGLFCYDEWEASEARKDDHGKITEPAVEAGNEYSIRYEEALCMEAAYQRRKNKILENRISELEKQVSDMLQILQNLTSSNG